MHNKFKLLQNEQTIALKSNSETLTINRQYYEIESDPEFQVEGMEEIGEAFGIYGILNLTMGIEIEIQVDDFRALFVGDHGSGFRWVVRGRACL